MSETVVTPVAPTDEAPADAVVVPAVEAAPAPEAKPDVFDRAAMEKARSEAARYRTERNDLKAQVEALATADTESKSQMQAVLKALGLAEDEQADPAKLLEQAEAQKAAIEAERDTERAELRALRIDNAVQKACGEANADTVLTSAILHTNGSLAALDPTADDFMAQVATLVSDAVTGNPKLKASLVDAPASGPDPQKSAAPKGDPTGPDGWREKLFPSK